jgi:hypothetical protein
MIIQEIALESVKEDGYPVHIDTKYCHNFLKTHKDSCKGCESFEGCERLLTLKMILAKMVDRGML